MVALGKNPRRVIRYLLMALSFVRLIAYPGLLPARSFVLYTLVAAFIAITSALSNIGLPELLFESLKYRKRGHSSALNATVIISVLVALFVMGAMLYLKEEIVSAFFDNIVLSQRTWVCVAMLSATSILSLCSSALVRSSDHEFAFPVLLSIKSLPPLIFIIAYSLTGLRRVMPSDLVVDWLLFIEAIACFAQFIYSLFLLGDIRSSTDPQGSCGYLSLERPQKWPAQFYCFLLQTYPKCFAHYLSTLSLPLLQNFEKLILFRFLSSALYQDYAYFSSLFSIAQASYNSYLQMATYRLANLRLVYHSPQLLFSATNRPPYYPDILIAAISSLAFIMIGMLVNSSALLGPFPSLGVHVPAFLSPSSVAPAAIASLSLPILALNYYSYLTGSFHRISLDSIISLMPSSILACAAMVHMKSIIAYAIVFLLTRLTLSLAIYFPNLNMAKIVSTRSR
jgi:hypothetical protein